MQFNKYEDINLFWNDTKELCNKHYKFEDRMMKEFSDFVEHRNSLGNDEKGIDVYNKMIGMLKKLKTPNN